MKIVNEMNINFASKSINESFARSVVSAFVLNLDPTINELADIKTAVTEAVTNSIVHGYKMEDGTIYINGKITDKNKVILKIRDRGCGIEDIEKAMEPLFTTAPEEERAGLGFAVMQTFMDKLDVRSHIGEGVRVVMTKKLG